MTTYRRNTSLTDDDKLVRSIPEFVRLDSKHTCPLCHWVLQCPVQTECGHRFCEKCVKDFTRDQENKHPGNRVSCPVTDEACGENINAESINPDFCARREISKLPVFCTYKRFGCKETTEWRKLKEHTDVCVYKGKDTPCPHCGQVVPEKLTESHLANDCPKVCVSCTYQCGDPGITRDTLDRHKETCTAKPEKCYFANFGCKFMIAAELMSKHMSESVAQHLDLVVTSIGDVDVKLDTARQEVESTRDLLQQSLDANKSLGRENEKLKSLFEDQQKKLRDLTKVLAEQAEKTCEIEKRSEKFASKAELDRHTREIIKLKDNSINHEGALTRLDRRATNTTGASEISGRFLTLDRQVGIQEVKLAEHDLRFQCIETGSHNGTLIWKVSEYTRRKQEAVAGRTLSLYSQPFYTSRYGYKMCARVYLNGDGQGRNTHMSLFFVVMRGDYDNLLSWPFRQKVTMTLLDQNGGRKHLSDTFRADPSSSSFRKPISEMNIASGCPLFAVHSVVDHLPYNVDDSVFIKITVDTSDLTTL